ncbi:alpha/beta-hydrolase [Lindgomyces ingoldianus]|uniref:Alpha/beta-hydrolase n=1 Tax=Lindgomyces ingoldianus TaxID=673940 RepID=A0ACB6Q8L8_9PLEO|nr:alpha/beta-hydrolase [Lindgomyces ingoldianus]KAF2462702.1 alpha/beta-hydrolase [Lindgomyces ingoldianus]
MTFLEANPIQLQNAPGNAAPLFLIHDGGGTIFNYFMLGDLGRSVYGIHDPKFESDDGWAGGIAEMAQEYITFIRTVRKKGPIVLGGWSLGGLVSLQIARQLDDERRHTEHGTQPLFAAGIILVDSPYTPPWREYRDRFVNFKPEFPSWTPQSVRKNVMRRFEVCDELIGNWEPPRWSAHVDENGGESTLQGNGSGQRVRPVSSCPPVVLLKATARVPLPKSRPDGLLDVDINRDDKLLGWERYGGDLFQTVHHVFGNHFDLFDQDDRVKAITNILKDTCAKWERSGF